jgi:hypothetical protein
VLPLHLCRRYWNYLRRQLYVLDTYNSRHNKTLNHTLMLVHSYGSAVFTAAVVTTSLQLLLLVAFAGPEVSRAAAAAVQINGSSSSVVDWQQLLLSCIPLSSWLFVALTASSLAAIRYMVHNVLQLFRVLSPGASDEVLLPQLSIPLLWLGWVLENAVLPFCMLYSFCCDHIVWGGIRYHKQGGKVSRVVHLQQQR